MENQKDSEIFHYCRISDFFKTKFPEIKMASECEKEMLLKAFSESHSFVNARTSLNKLSKFEDYSSKQINDFVDACINNNQIYWIKDVSDMEEMITIIISLNNEKINPDLKKKLDELYNYTK